MTDIIELRDAGEIRRFVKNYMDTTGAENLPEHLLNSEELRILKIADQAIYFSRLSEGDESPTDGLYTLSLTESDQDLL